MVSMLLSLLMVPLVCSCSSYTFILSYFSCLNSVGAGKTHTMIGNDAAGPGVMVLTMRDLFFEVETNKAEKNYKISMLFILLSHILFDIVDISKQYLEVYNETIRDLLVENSKALDLREDPDLGVFVAGLCERYPKTADEVLIHSFPLPSFLSIFFRIYFFPPCRYSNSWSMEMLIDVSLQRKPTPLLPARMLCYK